MRYLYKSFKYILRLLRKPSWLIVFLKFYLNRFEFEKDFKSNGIPVVNIGLKAKVKIGKHFHMNNGLFYNQIGRQEPCMFVVGGNLTIGDNVGLSGTAIICWTSVTIGNNVKTGEGTVIHDTDFHSLDIKDRCSIPEVVDSTKRAPVVIKDNVFIGAYSTILKGVTIGENCIIGACSVVTKDIPDNEIWAGNPARFIRKIDLNQEQL